MKRTLILAVCTLACMLAEGAAFSLADHAPLLTGFYWAIATATTVGYGDIVPHSGPARAIAVVVMLTAIPLLGATFASLTAMHVHRHVRDHVDRVLAARTDEPAEGEDPRD